MGQVWEVVNPRREWRRRRGRSMIWKISEKRRQGGGRFWNGRLEESWGVSDIGGA